MWVTAALRPPATPGRGVTIAEQVFAQANAAGIDLATARHTFNINMTPEVMATLFTTSAGWPPESIRIPGLVVDSAARPIQVLDAFGPLIPTTQAAVKFMRESAITNAAVEKAEGAALAEGTLALTEVTVPVRKIGVILPVTNEQLEDEPMVEAYLNRRLPYLLRNRLDTQLVSGSNTAPDLDGINRNAGSTTSAYASNAITKPMNDCLKIKTKVRTLGRTTASHLLIAPSVWQDIQLAETTAGGFYLGSPANAFEPRLWGMPVIECDELEDKASTTWAIAGDFTNMADVALRRDFNVEVGMQGADFARDAISLRATVRCALLIYRAAAFQKAARPAA